LIKNDKKVILEKEDEELIKEFQNNNSEAFDKLYFKYIGLIHDITFKFMREKNIAQFYFDDLLAIAIDSLLHAAQVFVVGQDRSFLNYWWKIVERRQINYFTKQIIKTSILSNPDDRERIVEPHNYRLAAQEKIYIIRELIHKNQRFFTKDEISFLDYFLSDYDASEIISLLNWTLSKYYRVKKNAFNKLNKIIKSN
jgi:DNA-directed RNA polymerase specialized sigma subunit